MRRALRILLNAATALSLLLCAAVAALWVRSYWAAQYVGRTDPAGWSGGLSAAGLLRFEYATFPLDRPGWSYASRPSHGGDGLWRELAARDRRGGPLKRLGFGYAAIDYDGDGRKLRYAAYAPHWAVLLPLSAAPAVRLPAAVRRRRRRRDAARTAARRCVACGYDLRATPDRCPECGTAPEVPT